DYIINEFKKRIGIVYQGLPGQDDVKQISGLPSNLAALKTILALVKAKNIDFKGKNNRDAVVELLVYSADPANHHEDISKLFDSVLKIDTEQDLNLPTLIT